MLQPNKHPSLWVLQPSTYPPIDTTLVALSRRTERFVTAPLIPRGRMHLLCVPVVKATISQTTIQLRQLPTFEPVFNQRIRHKSLTGMQTRMSTRQELTYLHMGV